jgi:hypothetical protein
MPNVIEHPSAPVSARKTEQRTKRFSKSQIRFETAQAVYSRAVLNFTHATAIHNRDGGKSFLVARTQYEVRETTALAVEAAAAILFGRDKPTSAKAAKYKAIAFYMGCAPAYEKISEVYPQ